MEEMMAINPITQITSEYRKKSFGSKEIFETKYIVPFRMREFLLAVLRQKTMVPGKFCYSKLKTVYFDDANKTSYFDTIDGNPNRKKYRFREYIDPEEGGAYYSLEVKIRSNATISKSKRLIYGKLPEGYTLTTFRDLISTFEVVLGCSLAFLYMELPKVDLFPTAIISYERYRFEDYFDYKRYNFDTKIRMYPRENEAISHSAYYLDYDIFEIKSGQREASPLFLRDLYLEPLYFSKFLWGKEIVEER